MQYHHIPIYSLFQLSFVGEPHSQRNPALSFQRTELEIQIFLQRFLAGENELRSDPLQRNGWTQPKPQEAARNPAGLLRLLWSNNTPIIIGGSVNETSLQSHSKKWGIEENGLCKSKAN